ncbi:MAG: helix-turn-helix domain-containing protein [Verrucomicrobia bacterium]|nr:helix-turn-helix domain-containing protein [Verrucomicrobiota bacterium]
MNTSSIPPVYLITLVEAAKRLSISRRTLEREIVRGRFPTPVKVGSCSRVPVAALENYLALLVGDGAREPFLRKNPTGGALANDMDTEMLKRIRKARAEHSAGGTES